MNEQVRNAMRLATAKLTLSLNSVRNLRKVVNQQEVLLTLDHLYDTTSTVAELLETIQKEARE